MPLPDNWVCFLLVLQNRVCRREDADKLVCLLAPQISQGKNDMFSCTISLQVSKWEQTMLLENTSTDFTIDLRCMFLLWLSILTDVHELYGHCGGIMVPCGVEHISPSLQFKREGTLQAHVTESYRLCWWTQISFLPLTPFLPYFFFSHLSLKSLGSFPKQRSVLASLSSCCSVPSNSKWRRGP